MRRNFLLFGIGLVLAGAAGEDALYVGWREASGTNVAENASVTFDGRLGVGDGGVFYKLGAGTLTLPLSQVDRQAPYAVAALEGTLSFAAGNATADATPPAFLPAETRDTCPLICLILASRATRHLPAHLPDTR